MQFNTSVNKQHNRAYFVRIAPKYALKAYTYQDKQKRYSAVIL